MLADWRALAGPDFDWMRAFLRPTDVRAATYPCQARPRCGCRHELAVLEDGRIMAPCRCEMSDCEPLWLTPAEVVAYELDAPALCRALAPALGLEAGADCGAPTGDGLVQSWLVGRTGALRWPVFFCQCPDESVFVGELVTLAKGHRDGFVALAATESVATPAALGVVEGFGAEFGALSWCLALAGAGRFREVKPMGPVFQRFEERKVARGEGVARVVEKMEVMHRDIATVARRDLELRQENGELKTAKARLEEIQREGLLKFAGKLDLESVLVACAILSEGDVAKASRALEMNDATLRAMLRRWEGMGPAYATLLDLVRWRKAVGGKTTVPFNDALFHEKAATVDAEGLLADVLDGLLSMTEQNWPELCDELVALLRPAVGR